MAVPRRRADLERAAQEQVAQLGSDRPRPDTQPTPTRPLPDTGPTPARNVRISNHDWEGLKRRAEAEGTSAGAIVRRLVRAYLNAT